MLQIIGRKMLRKQHQLQLLCHNPKSYTGYSPENWGLTASDEQSGYSAHSPTNDNGTISPTAAISSLPYDSAKSMAALRFFYYNWAINYGAIMDLKMLLI